jgi:hypothetical protein
MKMSETTNNDTAWRVIGFSVPPEIASATQAAAAKEMLSMSDLMRRALVTELKARGALPAK